MMLRLFKNLGVGLMLTACVNLVCAAEGAVSVNFDGVDLRVVIKFLSELTGQNYIVDPNVKGQVTVISPRQLSVNEAVRVLESALAVNNCAIVESDSAHKIVPKDEARSSLEFSPAENLADKSGGERTVTTVIELKNAEAEKVKGIIAPMLSKNGYISSFEGANALVISETRRNLMQVEKVIERLDQPQKAPAGLEKRLIRIKNTTPTLMAALCNKVFLNKKDNETISGGADKSAAGMNFVPNDSTGDLIVSAPAAQMPEIEKTIVRMDAVIPQILVEALIVEISDEKTREWGLELVAAGGAIFGTAEGFASSQTGGLTKAILTGGQAKTTSAAFVDRVKTVGEISIPDRAGLVRASEGNNGVKILSAPRILASNNEEAQILVGKNVPYIRNSQVTAEGGTVRTFEFKDVGLMLKVIPSVLEGSMVKIKVHQEVEDIVATPFEGAVETSKRMVTSAVYAHTAQTVILGGLKSDTLNKKVTRVPLLGHIPLLGKLFTSESKSSVKTNLFLFITPYIIESPQQADATVKQADAALAQNIQAHQPEQK